MKKGKFIVFEGLNGCGKDTQIEYFFKYLNSLSKAVPIFSTAEPNDFDNNGIRAREMLRDEKDPYIGQLKALEFFSKNRKNHNKIFVPMLEKGINVICNRYYYSNMVYQHAQGVPYEKIIEANKGIRIPDITFILNTSPEESLRRLNLRNNESLRKFDTNLDFNRKVWESYMELGGVVSSLMGDNSVQYIDGEKKQNEVFEKIMEICLPYF
jgi:dTMP kinase